MNKITQLIIDNKSAPRSFSISATAAGTRIDLYDVISEEYGVSSSDFVSALNNIKSEDIFLHINSPGGDVFAARAMVAGISAHPSKITAYIDGVAASAASYIACACDSVVMQDGSMMMIHRASTVVWGNSDQMVEVADLLDKIDSAIVADYARKTGKNEADLLAMMTAETWMTADEAVAHGFADSVVKNQKGKAKNTWNLSAFENVPAELKVIIEDEETPVKNNFMTVSNTNRLALITAL